MLYQDWTPIPKQQTKPLCSTCGSSTQMELVDVYIDCNQPAFGNTTPVWHCSICDKATLGRTPDMENLAARSCHMINSNGGVTNVYANNHDYSNSTNQVNWGTVAPDVSQSVVPQFSVMYNEIVRIAQEAMSWYDFRYNPNLGQAVKDTVAPELAAQHQNLLREVAEKVEKQLKEHLIEVSRIESDPLHEVRKRVANFRLT